MTPDEKLARITHSLKDAGIDALVMGGHAVRYYGIDRNTIDFDLVTSLATPEELQLRLPKIEFLEGIRAEPVWRSKDFARFEIGRLPDGREEWLEFWIRNHLLGNFDALRARAETGTYGGEQVAFLSLKDLIKSKETERESDWQDIALLEEVQDARHHAALGSEPDSLHRLLTNLRSRRGMDRVIERRLWEEQQSIVKAIGSCNHQATHAFLFPLAPEAESPALTVPMDSALIALLNLTKFGTPKHFALVEICRRAYKRHAMDIDRADKQRKLAQG